MCIFASAAKEGWILWQNKLACVMSYDRRIKYRTNSLANSRNSLISGKKFDLHFRGSSAP